MVGTLHARVGPNQQEILANTAKISESPLKASSLCEGYDLCHGGTPSPWGASLKRKPFTIVTFSIANAFTIVIGSCLNIMLSLVFSKDFLNYDHNTRATIRIFETHL